MLQQLEYSCDQPQTVQQQQQQQLGSTPSLDSATRIWPGTRRLWQIHRLEWKTLVFLLGQLLLQTWWPAAPRRSVVVAVMTKTPVVAAARGCCLKRWSWTRSRSSYRQCSSRSTKAIGAPWVSLTRRGRFLSIRSWRCPCWIWQCC